MSDVIDLITTPSFGSIVFGIVGILLPVVGLIMKRSSSWFSVCSLGACTISIILQLFELAVAAVHEDASNFLDTTTTRLLAGTVLFLVVLTLNVVYVVMRNRRRTS